MMSEEQSLVQYRYVAPPLVGLFLRASRRYLSSLCVRLSLGVFVFGGDVGGQRRGGQGHSQQSVTFGL